MPAWYRVLGVSDVLYRNNILWRSSFFGASLGGFYSSGFDTTAGVLKVRGLRSLFMLVCILFPYVVEA